MEEERWAEEMRMDELMMDFIEGERRADDNAYFDSLYDFEYEEEEREYQDAGAFNRAYDDFYYNHLLRDLDDRD